MEKARNKSLDWAEYHKHTLANRNEIEQSKLCGCASCQTIFPSAEVVDFIKDKGGYTALCPYCCIDAVIGDASGLTIDKRTLKLLGKKWF